MFPRKVNALLGSGGLRFLLDERGFSVSFDSKGILPSFDRGSLGFLLCFRGLRVPYFGRVFLSCSERFVSLLYLEGFRPLSGTEGLIFAFDSGYFSLFINNI